MSRIIAAAAIRGAHSMVRQAEAFYQKALEEKGGGAKVEFPDTGYYLSMAYALLGAEVKKVEDIEPVLEEAKGLLPEPPSDRLWLPYLGNALDAGIATLLGEEIITALRYLYGTEPQPDCEGFYTDTWMRQLGIQLVDGRMPGFAAILGAAPTNEIAVKVIRELQKRNILIFVGSSVNSRSIVDQLLEEGVQMGWDTYIVPYGRDTITGIYPLNWAIRAALTFGGLEKGAGTKALLYTKARVHAFGLTLGHVDDLKYATGAGAINMGFPIIADTDIPEIRPTGICTYEHVVHEFDYDQLVPTCIQVRGVKVKVEEVDIPVPYSAAFEGETVRRGDMHLEAHHPETIGLEYLCMRELDEIEDGKIEVVGPDFDAVEEGGSINLGILVEVAGRRMRDEFEPIMERQIHAYLNRAMGIFHMGQRNLVWFRISKDTFAKGFRAHHLGTILHYGLHNGFGAILDKVQVTIFTDREDVEKLRDEAVAVYAARDARLAGLTDEAVDTFYTCTLCQSYAPNHVCIVSPERPGLCGAYSWLDCRAAYEINPRGVNQPVPKGRTLDPEKGRWEGVDAAIRQHSHGNIETFNQYSIIENPMTSCFVGSTEVIVNGQLVQISDFVEEHIDEGFHHASALTMNEEGEAVYDYVVGMHKNPAPERLIRVATKSGDELLLTGNHKIAVDGPEGMTWVRADELQIGDRVYALKRLELPEHVPQVVDILPHDLRVDNEALIARLKKKLKAKYGSLAAASREIDLRLSDPRAKSVSLGDLKQMVTAADEKWEEVQGSIREVVSRAGQRFTLPQLTADLFYTLGLLASDGSIDRRGRHECLVNFINSNEGLLAAFEEAYTQAFPDRRLSRRRKSTGVPTIRGREIRATKACFDYYNANPLLGIISEHFGVKMDGEERWNLGRMISLPRELIASFIAGHFDGDGSVRLRKYDGKRDVGEAYLCIDDKRAARHLQLLLKRLGIVGDIRKSASVYKIELHGSNLRRFAEMVPSKHPEKSQTLREITALSKCGLDKTQVQVLPLAAGRALASLPASREVLSPSTLYYYKTARSRPVLDNVRRIIEVHSEVAETLTPLMDNDYFLDIVTEAEEVENEEYDYVYNLTLLDIHSYLVNTGVHCHNCGCFECIVALVPEANGFMVVNREHSGMTPMGAKFSTLAGMVGGGNQTPGFLGVGRLYLSSGKFIAYEGGLKRVVWMPKELKEDQRERLQKRAEALGEPDLLDKIADETVGTTVDEILPWLMEKNHPALSMEMLL